jgi:hypothetical protein
VLTSPDEIEMWGDGKQTRSFTYIDDCVEGILRITKSEFREPLNLGSTEMVSMNEMMQIVMDIEGKVRRDGTADVMLATCHADCAALARVFAVASKQALGGLPAIANLLQCSFCHAVPCARQVLLCSDMALTLPNPLMRRRAEPAHQAHPRPRGRARPQQRQRAHPGEAGLAAHCQPEGRSEDDLHLDQGPD